MIADVRYHENGRSRHLCDLDLLKFSEQQVRNRMNETGISEDAFFICAIKDWDVERTLDLREAYLLKKVVVELYDNDETIVKYLLKQGRSVYFIATHYYKVFGGDELEVLINLIGEVETERLLRAFFTASNWVNFFNQYVEAGYVLAIDNCFYLDMS